DAGPVRVRIGMETGEVIAEEQGYFGRTVFQASRISEVGGGGQIVVSQATRLIGGAEFDFGDLGDHELKGLGGPHRLFELEWRRPEHVSLPETEAARDPDRDG